jgi:hypothetical protein
MRKTSLFIRVACSVAFVCSAANSLACDTGAVTHVASSTLQQTEDAGLSDACGDGQLGADEECDPSVDGWEELCSDSCRRTVYFKCETSLECAGLNSNCSGYSREIPGQFCADYCEADSMCPDLPGFRAICNFAWCALRCQDGACPNGMTCIPEQTVLDHEGKHRSSTDICVPSADA